MKIFLNFVIEIFGTLEKVLFYKHSSLHKLLLIGSYVDYLSNILCTLHHIHVHILSHYIIKLTRRF